MGQRHQYLIVYPKQSHKSYAHLNQEQTIEVIHHQWLYGRNAIHTLDRVLTFVKNYLADNGEHDYMFGTTKGCTRMGDGTQAIAATMSVDPADGYYHQVHIFDEKFTAAHPLRTDNLDNNDGVTVIEFVAGQALPNVCFASPYYGTEGSHSPESGEGAAGPWSPAQFLSFYYTKAEQEAWKLDDDGKPDPEGVKVFDGVQAALARIAENSKPMTKTRLKKLLKTWEFGK